MVCAVFYMHQTNGVRAGICAVQWLQQYTLVAQLSYTGVKIFFIFSFCSLYYQANQFHGQAQKDEKHCLFDIRLLWFWNHGMVHACLCISFLCIYYFLHYILFTFLINISIAIYSWLYYLVERYWVVKGFFFCVFKPQQLSLFPKFMEVSPQEFSTKLVYDHILYFPHGIWLYLII